MQRNLHRVHLVTGQRTVGHRRSKALLHRRDELLGNITALDLVNERKAHRTVVGRADLEDDVGELTTATGLLLEHLAVLNRLGKRLLVVDLGGTLVDLDAELTAQTVDDDVEVQLTHTADDGLARILVGVNRKGGVLLSQFAPGRCRACRDPSGSWARRPGRSPVRGRSSAPGRSVRSRRRACRPYGSP